MKKNRSSAKALPLAAALFGVVAAHAQAQTVSNVTFTASSLGTFLCNMTYANSGQLSTVDIDGDGKLDFSGQSARSITVLRHNAAGGLDQMDFPLPLAGTIYQHFWSDCNNDGKPDLILKVIGNGTSDGGQIWLNDGAGHLSFAKTFPLIELENIMNVGDLDGDGVAEIVTIDFNRPIGVDDPSFYLYQSTGAPATYAPRKFLHQAKGLTFLGDFNADGRQDIAIFKYGPRSDRRFVRIFSNNGNRTFKDNGDIKLGAGDMTGAADLNGDGKCDLFGYNGAVLRTDSLSKMTALTYPSSFLGNNRFYVGDFNGDRKTDFLNTGMDFRGNWGYDFFAGASGGSLSVFTTQANLGDYGINASAAATDFDGDGKTDLVRFIYDTDTGVTSAALLTAH